MRAIRTAMKAAGLKVESSKGEAWPGQHEINFRYADALEDRRRPRRSTRRALKTLAHQCGMSVTFMAKPDHTWVGSSCHIHSSLWRDGESAFAGETRRLQALPRRPDRAARRSSRSSSRRRSTRTSASRRGSWAPTTLAWALRQPHVRLPHRRARHVAAAGDAHPRRRRESVPRVRGAARRRASTGSSRSSSSGLRSRGTRTSPTSSASRTRCATRSTRLERGTLARRLLGDEVVDHYLNYARTEQRLFDEVVTSYERERMFERG